jgi:hypothetical protein
VFGRRLSLVVALLLAGCGSASQSVTFAAPPNFHERASIGSFAQVWETSDKRSVLVLTQLPTQIDLRELLREQGLSGAKVRVKKMIAICGSQPAVYVEAMGTGGGAFNIGIAKVQDSKRTPSAVDFIGTNVNGHTYMAVYTRPLHAPPDPAAEDAIHKVCPK